MGSFKRSLPYAFSFAAAVFMVMAAELIGDNEIIFPEITAVAIGALAAPKRAWNTSRLRLFLTISAAAFLGVGIVRFVPLPLVFQVPLGLVCADVGNAVGNGIYPCGFGMCAADINGYGECSLHNIGGCYGRNDPAYTGHSRKAWGA